MSAWPTCRRSISTRLSCTLSSPRSPSGGGGRAEARAGGRRGGRGGARRVIGGRASISGGIYETRSGPACDGVEPNTKTKNFPPLLGGPPRSHTAHARRTPPSRPPWTATPTGESEGGEERGSWGLFQHLRAPPPRPPPSPPLAPAPPPASRLRRRGRRAGGAGPTKKSALAPLPHGLANRERAPVRTTRPAPFSRPSPPSPCRGWRARSALPFRGGGGASREGVDAGARPTPFQKFGRPLQTLPSPSLLTLSPPLSLPPSPPPSASRRPAPRPRPRTTRRARPPGERKKEKRVGIVF